MTSRVSKSVGIQEEPLLKLQDVRRRLARPLIVRAADRSPAHNRVVGGALGAEYHDGTAFGIATVNHDPIAFEAAARAVGFLALGFYPRSRFIHIDLGTARNWGERLQETLDHAFTERAIGRPGYLHEY